MRAVRLALSSLSLIAALCCVFGARAAWSQPYAVSTQSAVFVPVTAGAARALLQGTDPPDNGRATLPIGFPFPYFGQTYTQLTVTANGVAVFEPGACVTCDFAANAAVPNAALPNGVLAPLWDDLKLSWPTSGVFYETRGNEFVVEWRDLNHWFATSQYKITAQLRLSVNGQISFHYGSVTGAGSALSATIGIESRDGTVGSSGKSCSPGCAANDLIPNERITFSAPAAVELSVPGVSLDSIRTVSDGGTDLEVTATTTIRNFSQADAGGVTYALFLSDDRQYSPFSDLPMTPNTLGPLEIPALGAVTQSATAVVPRPLSGKWHVVAFADPFGAFSELDETNNSNGTDDTFAVGVDLRARGVMGPLITGPGEAVTVSVDLSNDGVDDAGITPLLLKLVADGSADGGGTAVYSAPVQLGARQRFTGPLSFNMPSNVPPGQFRWALHLDPAGLISEQDEANNLAVASGLTTVSRNDLVVESVSARKAVAPFDPARHLFFGEPGRFDVSVSNRGGAATQGAVLSLYLSVNATLNAVTDTRIIQVPISVAAGETKLVPVTVTLPLVDRAGAAYVNGSYFVIALGISPSDADGLNDIAASGPVKLFLPGPDLVVRSVNAPSTVASGERFTLSRRFANAGSRDAGAAQVRYFLSVNDIVTTGDVPLEIADGGTRTVAIAAAEDSVGFEDVVVPENLAQGSYYVSAIVDAANAVFEFDETNNAFAGTQVTVLGSSLNLDAVALPDAVVNRPYHADLVATGGTEAIIYAALTLPPGLSLSPTGALSGTPTQVGSQPVVVRLTAGSKSNRSVAVVRVLPNSTVLDVATRSLPPVQRTLPYDFQLAARGGQKPYRWSLQSGALPGGMTLDAQGRLSGLVSGAPGNFAFTVRLVDGPGTVVERTLQLRVAAAGALVLQTAAPPAAQVGVEYATDFYAVNANGSQLATSLRWSVIEGALPPGLSLDPRPQLLLVRGVPTKVGIFVTVLQATDLEGRSDAVSVVFYVYGSSALILGELPSLVRRGDEVTGRFISDGARDFRVASGTLPEGLVVDANGGLSGRVADDASAGSHSFLVTATDVNGVDRLGGFAIEVEQDALASPPKCGCSMTQTPALALLLAVFALRRRTQATLR